jgi:hypothetical protein
MINRIYYYRIARAVFLRKWITAYISASFLLLTISGSLLALGSKQTSDFRCIPLGSWIYKTHPGSYDYGFWITHIIANSQSRLLVNSIAPEGHEPMEAWFASSDSGETWEFLEENRNYAADIHGPEEDEYFGRHAPRGVGATPTSNVRYLTGCGNRQEPCPDGKNSIWRSMDAGKTWQMVKSTLTKTGERIWFEYPLGRVAVTVDPTRPKRIYAIGRKSESDEQNRLFLSVDGGNTFEELCHLKGYFRLFEINKNRPDFIIAVDNQDYVQKSEDGGKTWQYVGDSERLRAPAVIRNEPQGTIDYSHIVFHPDQKETVFLVTTKGIMRSTDAGGSWCMLLIDQDIDYINTMGPLVFDPGNHRNVFLGTWYGLYRSRDGGQHWQLIDIRKRCFNLKRNPE